MKKFISGWIITALGAILAIYTAITIHTDIEGNWYHSYTYTPPFTEHELFNIILMIIAIAAIIAGVVMLRKNRKE